MALDELRRWLAVRLGRPALRGRLVRVSGVFGFAVRGGRRGERRSLSVGSLR